jgi:hypothetical protein
MKKLIFAILGVLTAVNGLAQGYVNFQNNAANRFFVLNYSTFTTNPATSGPIGAQDGVSGSTGTIDVGLYWSTTPFTLASQGTLAAMATINAASPGILDGNSSLAIAGTTGGEQVYLQLFMWDSTFPNPDAALAAGYDFGAGSAGTVNFNNYGVVGPAVPVTLGILGGIYATPIFGPDAGEFNKTFMLNGSPEPATVAIGGLGAAALLVFRRRSRI